MNDMGSPVRRSLSEVVEACEIVESELTFQVARLNEHVKPRTEEEGKYHEELKEGYRNAMFYVRVLRRYQQGRLERQQSGDTGNWDEGASIDEKGRATAFTGDEE